MNGLFFLGPCHRSPLPSSGMCFQCSLAHGNSCMPVSLVAAKLPLERAASAPTNRGGREAAH